MTTRRDASASPSSEELVARGLIQMTGRTVVWEGLALCTACGWLRGTIDHPEADRPLEQRCDCQPGDAPRWPGHDFNMAAELCRCCGQVLLPSGSKFSVWFCRGCLGLVGGLNQRLNRYAIPIGRHSFHGGLMLAGDASEIDRAAFIETWAHVERAMDRVRDWSRLVVRAVLEERWPSVPAGIPIESYLDRCDPADEEKLRRFRKMIDYLRDG
jgi:hypothetical protein